jgi:hypothetical protein
MKRAPAIAKGWSRLAVLSTVVGAGGCGGAGLQGFGGPPTPLVTFQMLVSGDIAAAHPPGDPGTAQLRVALVWGAQWLTEPFCVLPPESDPAAAVIAAGCRDSFAFVPALVAANVPVEVGTPASLSLFDLPAADVMVGDITSRVAYGSMVVYDDRDGDGTLGLAIPRRLPGGGPGPPQPNIVDSRDIVYGASFVTMTAPDQRVSFSEGVFHPSAFYPRSGCQDPEKGFRVLGAGGFSAADGLATAVSGVLPPENPATCTQALPADAVIGIAVQDPASVQEVSCVQRSDDSSIRYREPPANSPDLNGRITACAHLPSFDEGGTQSSLIQLVVSGRASDRCKGLTHYTLRGCRRDVACAAPDWDFTATPPAWWPCPQ